MRAFAPAFTKETRMFDLSAQFGAASLLNHAALAMLLLAPALRGVAAQRFELAEVARGSCLMWELLPSANAPPDSDWGSS